MAIANRLARLEGASAPRCSSPSEVAVVERIGADLPPGPLPDLTCPGCGKVHAALVTERVVRTREEYQALREANP